MLRCSSRPGTDFHERQKALHLDILMLFSLLPDHAAFAPKYPRIVPDTNFMVSFERVIRLPCSRQAFLGMLSKTGIKRGWQRMVTHGCVVGMSENSDRKNLESNSAPVDLNGFLQRFRLRENGGRRLTVNRRWYQYTLHIPERRSGYERRIGHDRRKAPRTGSRLSLA